LVILLILMVLLHCQKNFNSTWCSHPDITGLASLPASIHNLGEDTCISQLNFLSPSLSICLTLYMIWGKSICFTHLGMLYVYQGWVGNTWVIKNTHKGFHFLGPNSILPKYTNLIILIINRIPWIKTSSYKFDTKTST
jgi:hypothetical protein